MPGGRRDAPGWFAVDGVSFTIDEGETLGLVGESGCGKSTLGRTVLLLENPTSGEIGFQHETLDAQTAGRLRRRAQIVFQDPYTSLPPRMRVGRILAEPFLIHRTVARSDIPDRVAGCCATSASSRMPFAAIRTSCPAVSVSAWGSRGPWRCSRR